MPYNCGRIIYTEHHGFPLKPVNITDNETGLIITNETRVALIKLLGSMSRDEYSKRKLTGHETEMLHQLYQMVQT